MHYLAPLVLSAALSPLAFAAPSQLTKRLDTTTHCGQWDSVETDEYILYINQWGKDNADSGEACGALTSESGDSVGWTTNWTWSGGEGVKSYTNINAKNNLNLQLSAISSIKSSWSFTQETSGSPLTVNVAYDLFTSSTSAGTNEYEIMIWLDNIGAGPISYTYSAEGNPTPVAEGLDLEGKTWDLYFGSNGANEVYSFLTSDGSSVTNFSGDINSFFTYLTSEQTLDAAQYLTTAQGGTEATEGTGTLTSSEFSIVIA